MQAPVGTLVWITASGVWARQAGGGWRLGDLPATSVSIGGMQVVGARQPPVATVTGGTTIDTEARTAIAAILGVLRTHGLIES